MPRLPRIPSYRLHKPTSHARVTLNGRDYFLGPWNSEPSKRRYEEIISEWLSNGRKMPEPVHVDEEFGEITVVELIVRYLSFAEQHYRKNGKPTQELSAIKSALAGLRKLYGRSTAAHFGPKKLKTVRQLFIDQGLARTTCNKYTYLIVRFFKWACEEELVPAHLHHGLTTVRSLQRGRTKARETDAVKPVDDATVEATLEHLGPIVADMVRLQRLTGMRPIEVCTVKPCDIDRSGEIWLYSPEVNKNEHHGKSRIVPIGPRGQELLAPYLMRDYDSYCFRPDETNEQHYRERRLSRTSRTNFQERRVEHPKLKPGESYTTATYRRAIQRAAKRATVSQWSPNQLRHAAGTEIRKQFGLEAAQVSLGHSTANTTQIYAERDLSKAIEVARQVG